MVGYRPARGRARAKQLAAMTPEQIDAEKAARLERNRLCARECRQRKKGRDNENQQIIDELRAEVADQAATIGKLKVQLAHLQVELAAPKRSKPPGDNNDSTSTSTSTSASAGASNNTASAGGTGGCSKALRLPPRKRMGVSKHGGSGGGSSPMQPHAKRKKTDDDDDDDDDDDGASSQNQNRDGSGSTAP